MAQIQQSIVGFELGPALPPTGAVYGWLAEAAAQGYVAGDITAGAKRSGSYGLNAGVAAASAGPTAVIRLLAANTGLPGDEWEMRARFFYRIVTLPDANNLVVAWINSGSISFEFQLQMNTSGQLRAVPSFVGGTTTAYQGSFTTNVWYQVKLRFYGAGSGGQVNGTTKQSSYLAEVYSEDGETLLATFSESQPIGNNMPDKWPALVDLGQPVGVGGPVCTRELHYDDFWCHIASAADVADMEWPRGTKVEGYAPVSNGDTNQFTRGGVDTGANWSQVNDIPKISGGGTTYVQSSTAGNIDEYAHANLVTSTDVVYHIQVLCFWYDDTTPQRLLIGAEEFESAAQASIGVGIYGIGHKIYSNAATLSGDDFNALQFGIKKQSGATTLFSEQEFLEVLTGPPNIIEEDLAGSDWEVTPAVDAIGGLVNPGGDNDITLATAALGFRLGGQGVEINVPTPWGLYRLDVGYRDEEKA